jgi:hypothetical protein
MFLIFGQQGKAAPHIFLCIPFYGSKSKDAEK